MPALLRFRILTSDLLRITAGTQIRYRLSWHGLPLVWTTEIRRWEPPFRFVDVQLTGPYRLWHHTHRFELQAGGTSMTDIVRYKLPLGLIGRAMQVVTVRREVEQIFDYRRRRIQEVFGGARLALAR